ncbi:MAG: RNA methyltransferase [Saprospiraceae bacterium]|jgi:TrmH family RNA methyltransferase|nr:RNA methyltransferase [Saprospiraceae bacterium]
MVQLLSSPSNPAVKRVVQLMEKARTRREEGLFVAEGRREVRLALESGYQIHSLFFCPGVVAYSTLLTELGDGLLQAMVYEVTTPLYEKMAYRESTEGVIAVLRIRSHTLESIHLPEKDPFILVAQAPEKPGNLGALLRSADAAGVDAVLIADPHTDLYNPNIIRSSVGGVFTNNIAMGSSADIIEYLRKKGISLVCAVLAEDTVSCFDASLSGPVAIVVGTESTGLTREWHLAADQKVKIPMAGKLDSINLSASAAILLFETVRQRKSVSG